MMRLLIALALPWQLWHSVLYANTLDSNLTLIDTQALDNKRLFFSEIQRQVGDMDGVDNGKKKHITPSLELGSDEALHYTGVVHSARGVQLLLNGYPWLPGQLAVVSARLHPDTQLIEIETANGELHRLLPGDTLEINP